MIIKIDDGIAYVGSYDNVDYFINLIRNQSTTKFAYHRNEFFDCITFNFETVSSVTIRGIKISFNKIYIDEMCIHFIISVDELDITVTEIESDIEGLYKCDFIELEV